MAASRHLKLTLSVPSTASTTTAGAATPGFGSYDALKCIATVTGLTGGTIDLYIQHSIDSGVTWYDCARFTQIASGAAAATVEFSTTLDSTIRAIGSGVTPALAANTVCAGPWGDQLRLIAVTGSGTSGAAAVQTVDIWAWQQNR